MRRYYLSCMLMALIVSCASPLLAACKAGPNPEHPGCQAGGIQASIFEMDAGSFFHDIVVMFDNIEDRDCCCTDGQYADGPPMGNSLSIHWRVYDLDDTPRGAQGTS